MSEKESKRRYTVTLTPSNVERFQNLCRDLKLPLGTMSQACDDSIRELAVFFQRVKDSGSKSGIKELFKQMGEQMELIVEYERRSANEQNGEKTSGGSKVAQCGN